MTKQEIINEAWCNQCLDKIDENGWVNLGYCVNGIDDVECWLSDNFFRRRLDKWEIDYSELDNGEFITTKIRPKSLQGIENNLGWVNIDSDGMLPSDNGLEDYYVFKFSNQYKFIRRTYKRNEVIDLYNQGEITHYRPIEKPKLPIY